MNHRIRISIVTPSFNQASYLKQAIRSVVSQNYPNLDYIIIDGGSKDGSAQVIRQYKEKLSYWISESDFGQSHAINKGIKKAKGEIITWLNSDDFYEPQILEKVNDVFQDSKILCCCGRSRLFNLSGTLKYSNGTDVYTSNLSKTIGWARIDQPATFFRKEAWDRVGLLNEQLHYTMDREWWMRYLYLFGLDGILKIDDVLVNFRLHETSKTVSSKERFQMEHDTIFYILSTLLKDKKVERFLRSTMNLDMDIDSEIRHWTDQRTILSSINYYLLRRAEEVYYQGDHSLCREFISFVRAELLAKEDRFLLVKIKLRSRLPRSVVRFFRK